MNAISYHHGDLRRAILDAAAEAITEFGPSGWSLRELARRAGVSHAAPAHHFGDKKGLLSALAAEGYTLLSDALEAEGDDFVEVGIAYLRFAINHRAHFEVMFQPGLYRSDDPAVVAARERADALLVTGVRSQQGSRPDEETTALAAWSLVHGFAGLWLTGAISERGDPEEVARPVLRRLFES
ncbi:TetR/AcrR family transcriptional regulator [Saccharopolyspora taberi]|uniref:TetR/AcrR family transcriptional regulator n=1 Tax=Saccharopolyspora taberi TaxID=60895 RepID=UPI0031CFA711